MQIIGEVVALSGDVRALLGGEEHILDQGSPIHQGETILTAQGSSVQIHLADDSILAQGENASQTIDSFIFDPANASASSMLINMAQGTFRMVTGQVGKANPEGIAVQTPLASIGIRGTGIDLDIQGAIAKVGCFLYDGLDVTITTEQGTRFLTAVNSILDILADGTFGEIRTYSDFEKAFFKAAVPLLGLPEDGLYGDDGADGQAGGGDDDAPDGGDHGDDTDGGDGTHDGTTDMAELFDSIFGTEGQPNQTLQELFQALTGEGNHLGGGVTDDTLGGSGQDDLLDTIPGTGGTGEDDHGGITLHSTVTNGDDDGSLWDTSDIAEAYIHDYTAADDSDVGNANNELFRGYGGDDQFWGADGNDTLFGGTDNDSLDGGIGNDLLVGGTGDDTLYGHVGLDTLWGGSGADTFRYDGLAHAGDTIKDFQTGVDSFYFLNAGGFMISDPVPVTMYDNTPGAGSFFTPSAAYTDTANEVATSGKGFVFDDDHNLWYDPDFCTGGNAVLIATVEGDLVQATDIHVHS
ncbi:MAG: FecR domain-containing protein [Proteobacteria bacterium]|nr:FecR domain-containing protein [Pseudomonadota bacterium]